MAPESVMNTVEFISQLQEYELLLSQLYRSFAQTFSSHETFWLSLSNDEARHSKLFDELKGRVGDNLLILRSDVGIDRDFIFNEMKMMVMYKQNVNKKTVSHKRAIAVAKQIEESLLDRGFEKLFDTQDESTRKLINILVAETKNHAASLEVMATKKDQFNYLVEQKIVTAVQMELVRTLAIKSDQSPEAILISRFNVSREEILKGFEHHYKINSFNVKDHSIIIPNNVLNIIIDKYDMMKAKVFVPVDHKNGLLRIVMADPVDLILRDDINRFFSSIVLEFVVGIQDDILEAIDRLFEAEGGGKRQTFEKILGNLEEAELHEANQKVKGKGKAEPDAKADEKEISEDDSSVVQLVNLAVEDAYKKNTSDIHIETSPEKVGIRYRIDGELSKQSEFPGYLSKAVISRIKIMAGLDIAEKRKPQSGKINFKRWGRYDCELRVETYPTFGNNEDAVLRILSSKKPIPLKDLNLSLRNLGKVEELLAKPYGMFLCVGPTGSGKTTTLHSCLGSINNDSIKILTIEDPVEITQAGLRQVQVNRKAGLGFPEALRSFLRSDPDVIMVGEMRDFETASIAVESSLTGHLVFSTLHTNSASETLTRLIDMGIDPYSFSDAILGVLAQRLVRHLCPKCKTPMNDKKVIQLLESEYSSKEAFGDLICKQEPELCAKSSGGCDECGDTGFKGRIAIHEFLVVSEGIKALMVRKASASEVAKLAEKEGMTTLKQDGIEKVIKGLTTIDEVRMACMH